MGCQSHAGSPVEALDEIEIPEGSIEISLSEAWGHFVLGPKKELTDRVGPDSKFIAEEGELVKELRRALEMPLPPDEKASPGFCVEGTGLEALRNAHAVLVLGQQPKNSFPAGSEISIFFFSHQCPTPQEIYKVTRLGSVVDVRYRFLFNTISVDMVYEAFAIIPLSDDLPVGEVAVNIDSTANGGASFLYGTKA